MQENKNKIILLLLSILTLALVYFAPDERQSAIVAPRLKDNKSAIASHNNQSTLRSRKPFDPLEGSLFATVDPPSPRHHLEIKQKPTAPPLPFIYMGKQLDVDKIRIFLLMGDKTYIVSVGDTIDNKYIVEQLNATSITLKYIPLDETQTLSIKD
jgi:hypothetical protein